MSAMAEVQEVTIRLSARLVEKLGRLAEEAYESPETFIESALAHHVRAISMAKRRLRELEQDGAPEAQPALLGQYL